MYIEIRFGGPGQPQRLHRVPVTIVTQQQQGQSTGSHHRDGDAISESDAWSNEALSSDAPTPPPKVQPEQRARAMEQLRNLKQEGEYASWFAYDEHFDRLSQQAQPTLDEAKQIYIAGVKNIKCLDLVEATANSTLARVKRAAATYEALLLTRDDAAEAEVQCKAKREYFNELVDILDNDLQKTPHDTQTARNKCKQLFARRSATEQASDAKRRAYQVQLERYARLGIRCQ